MSITELQTTNNVCRVINDRVQRHKTHGPNGVWPPKSNSECRLKFNFWGLMYMNLDQKQNMLTKPTTQTYSSLLWAYKTLWTCIVICVHYKLIEHTNCSGVVKTLVTCFGLPLKVWIRLIICLFDSDSYCFVNGRHAACQPAMSMSLSFVTNTRAVLRF